MMYNFYAGQHVRIVKSAACPELIGSEAVIVTLGPIPTEDGRVLAYGLCVLPTGLRVACDADHIEPLKASS